MNLRRLNELTDLMSRILYELDHGPFVASDIVKDITEVNNGLSDIIVTHPGDSLNGVLGEIIRVGDNFLDELATDTLYDHPDKLRWINRWDELLEVVDTILTY